jgi:hypothetical protein
MPWLTTHPRLRRRLRTSTERLFGAGRGADPFEPGVTERHGDRSVVRVSTSTPET